MQAEREGTPANRVSRLDGCGRQRTTSCTSRRYVDHNARRHPTPPVARQRRSAVIGTSQWARRCRSAIDFRSQSGDVRRFRHVKGDVRANFLAHRPWRAIGIGDLSHIGPHVPSRPERAARAEPSPSFRRGFQPTFPSERSRWLPGLTHGIASSLAANAKQPGRRLQQR